MGPGRLTGMNECPVRGCNCAVAPGFNGARSIDRDERCQAPRLLA